MVRTAVPARIDTGSSHRHRPGYDSVTTSGRVRFPRRAGYAPDVDWVVLGVLLLVAAVLAAQGARLVTGGRRAAEDGEEGTDRAVLSLVLVGAALGVGAAGAAVAAAGSAGPVQAAVFAAAAAAVALPVAGVLLASRR